MTKTLRTTLVWLLCIEFTLVAPGCGLRQPAPTPSEAPLRIFQNHALDVDYPDVATPIDGDLLATPPPLSVVNAQPIAYRDLPLREAIYTALANAKMLRDLGGQLLRTPQNAPTVYGPAAQESDPRFGVEGALSAFDATYSSTAYFEKNDRALNNIFFGGGTRLLRQDAYVFQNQLTKRAATGTQLTVRNITDYDANNAPGNAFPSAWNSNIEMEYRHPLLQGGGVDFNRIAGPGATPGVYNGVMIARINTDISLADLENGVRLLLSDVENAYWDLYFAYRDLDSKITARNTALETWRRIRSLYDTGRRGGEAEKEAHAREQYYRFEEEVQNALAGQLLDGTRTYNGSSGGTFRGIGGVQTCERRLRLLMGLPIVDGELLRPTDEPVSARVVFDWQESVAESLGRRVELRKQRWLVKRREMELSASRNFLMPQLDTVGRYRWRGFGDRLIGGPSNEQFNSALGTLFDGNLQEWQLGMELNVPIGFRRANAAVRNAQANLARERAVLRELERQVVHDLSAATADADRAFLLTQTTYNRRLATHEQLAASQAAFDADKVSLDFVLESQRLAADSEVRYHRALVEHAIALKNVQFERGALLEYNGVGMAESPWVDAAYRSPTRTDGYRLPVGPLNYVLSPGRRVSLFPLRPAIEPLPEVTNPVPVEPVPQLPDASLPQSPSPVPQLEASTSSQRFDLPSPVFTPNSNAMPAVNAAPAATEQSIVPAGYQPSWTDWSGSPPEGRLESREFAPGLQPATSVGPEPDRLR